MRKERRWGVVIFGGEEGEEARWLHCAGGRRHKKSGAVAGEAEGGSWRLEVKDDQRKLSRWAECAVGPNC
jgi:1,4-dihydroxy-2-naphthoyl-CoA synthase